MKNLEKNWLEWSVFGISALLVLGMLGYLVYNGATSTSSPPLLSVSVGQGEQHGAQYLVPITVSNAGSQTAEAVQVTLTLTGTQPSEVSSVQLNYVPRGSQRQAWVTFHSDPHSGSIEARIEGFAQP